MLYQIQFDDESDYVEASSFSEAIKVWHRYMAEEQGAEWDKEQQPDSVALVHEKSVWR